MNTEDLEFDMEAAEESFPDMDEAGPSALGRTPAIGNLRREKGLPVLRDEVPDLTEEL